MISKAAWGNFHPAPPLRGGGIRKFPAGKLKVTSEPSFSDPKGTTYTATHRGRRVSELKVNGSRTIDWAGTEPGFRRRGAAGHVLRAAEKDGPVHHSANRSVHGDAWAAAMGKARKTPEGKSTWQRQAALESSPKRAKAMLKGRDWAGNGRSVSTIAASSTRTGAATRGPLTPKASRALGQRRQVKKAFDVDFLDMPGMMAKPDTREESLTAVRTRDLKTGRFVGAPTLVAKKMTASTSIKHIMEGTTAAVIGGVVANQLPQNRRSSKKTLKKLDMMDPSTTVTLKKKGNAHA